MKYSLNKSNSKKTNTSRKRKKYKTLQKSLKNKKRKYKSRNINTFKQLFLYNDKKIFLLLKRTFFLQEISKIEHYINSEKFLCEKLILSKKEYNMLITKYNNVLDMRNLYVCLEDLFKSLLVQNKIINILKLYLINKINQTE